MRALFATTSLTLLLACSPAPQGDPPDAGVSTDANQDVPSDQHEAQPDTLDIDLAVETPDLQDAWDADEEPPGDLRGDLPSDLSPDQGDPLADLEEDTAPDLPLPEPTRSVLLPLGETLFLDGDDHLADWGRGRDQPVELLERPSPQSSGLEAGGWRLTPDRPGRWLLRRGQEVVAVEARGDLLGPDTLLNYNYTPLRPLALDSQGDLWVADPPSNAVQRVALSPQGAQAAELVPVGAWPTSLALWEQGGYLLVSLTGRDALGWVDLEQRRLVDALPVGDEPAGLVIDAQRGLAYVALSGPGLLARVDLNQRRLIDTLAVGRDPRSLAWDPQRRRLYVASMVSGNTTPRGRLQSSPLPPETQPDVAIVDVDAWAVQGWLYDVGATLRGLTLHQQGQRLLITHSLAHNTGDGIDAEGRPHSWHLSVYSVDPEAEDFGQRLQRVDLDEQPSSTGPAPDPFSLALDPARGRAYLTLAAAQQVMVLELDSWAELARVPVGHDPRGLLLDGQGRAWTFAWLSNQVQALALEPLAPGQALEVGRDPTPPDLKEGQRIFHDANFSRHGDFACASCHPDGLTDGLVWNILLDGDVNTQAFRNVAGTGPFLWGGLLPTLFDFSREVLRLVGAQASGHQMELLTRYMQSVTAPPNPFALPGGRLTPQAQEGKRLFETPVADGGGGCQSCHSGPLLTAGIRVLGKTPGLRTDVPSLIAVYDSGPWGRQGQWSTLDQMTREALRFTGASLRPEQIQALVAWMQQAPGDLLYLNSASPLPGDNAAWIRDPVELAFSSNLAPGQERAFELHGADGAPVPGHWEVQGKRARFVPEGGELAPQSSYQVRVAAGLRGQLGRTAPEALLLDFQTGAGAALDLSGTWTWELSGDIEGSVEVAFLQARGGRASGALLETNAPIDFDHVQGYVSGEELRLSPFLIHSPLGDLQVERVLLTLEDSDQDGYADTGRGTLETLVTLQIQARRASLPLDP